MSSTRRSFLAASAGLGAAALSACSGTSATPRASGAGGAGPVSLRFMWWGNDLRNQITAKVMDLYKQSNPSVTITGEPGEWGSYWDKLATSVAGGNAPDVIQMDERYLREYTSKGVLYDLLKLKTKVDTSAFGKGVPETGTIDGKLIAMPIGINSPSMLANPAVFESLGIPLPDDKTWTWDTLRDVSAAITKKAAKPGTYGLAGYFIDNTLSLYLRQKGKSMFTANGLGFEPADLAAYLQIMLDYMNAGATPTAQLQTEESGKSIDQGMFAGGRAALTLAWSNQISAFEKAVGKELKVLQLPSMDGTVAGKKTWYKSGAYISVSSKAKDPEAAGRFVDFFVNSKEAGELLLTERGAPPNLEIRKQITSKLSSADQKSLTFLTDIAPGVGDPPPPPPVGASSFQTVLNRYMQDVLFGKSTPQVAATACVNEAKSSIK